MLKGRHPHFPRWLIIFLLTFLSYLSGVGEIGKSIDNNVFLRNNLLHNAKPMQTDVVQASTSARSTIVRHNSQVSQLSIETKKDTKEVPVPTNKVEKEWGISKQIDEHTWTIEVGQDKKIATAQEVLSALNSYRQKKGKGTLSWDSKLADYAQSRAAYFASSSKLDSHAGFSDYLNNQDGFNKLGFASLGENSSFGYVLEGVHLIEWVYAGDKPHDDNQLSSDWSHVGIGISGTATNLNFGGKKL